MGGIDLDKGKFNKFMAGLVIIAIASFGIVWFTNPELIKYWFVRTPLKGELLWQASSSSVIVKNNTDIEWKDVKVTLNKNSVTQRYEVTVPSIKRFPTGYHIPVTDFKKSNGEAYDVNIGAPRTITIDVMLPDDKQGSLEVNLGGGKL